MGDSGDQPPWAGATIADELDSVDAQFAGEFSEETRSLMKGYGKPKWLEEESSLDPVDEIEDHQKHELRLPPSTYDAAQEAAAEQAAELRAAARQRLGPEDEALIRYRKALVDGTSLDELKLLKLRAYHRAMDLQHARHAAARTARSRQQLMEEYEVPLDVVPMDLIDMTPEQLADRWAAAQHGGERSNSRAWDCSTEDSEWAPDWAATDYLKSEAGRRSLQAMLTHRPRSHVQAAPALPPEVGQVLLHGDPAQYQHYHVIHGHTPEYLEQQQLQRKWRNQQRQRALAFWLPLGSLLGLYAVKGLRSLLKARRAKPVAKGKKKKLAM